MLSPARALASEQSTSSTVRVMPRGSKIRFFRNSSRVTPAAWSTM